MAFAATSLFAFAQDYTQYVDPFIGTGGHGHVFLGANVPFGNIQAGPTQKKQAGTGVLVIITAIQRSLALDRCT